MFLVHPTSISAVDDSRTVEFTCTANRSEDIIYRVNNTSAEFGSITGFHQSDIDDNAFPVIKRNLSVTVSSLHNNTEILCEARKNDNIVESNRATLTVQGKTCT